MLNSGHVIPACIKLTHLLGATTHGQVCGGGRSGFMRAGIIAETKPDFGFRERVSGGVHPECLRDLAPAFERQGDGARAPNPTYPAEREAALAKRSINRTRHMRSALGSFRAEAKTTFRRPSGMHGPRQQRGRRPETAETQKRRASGSGVNTATRRCILDQGTRPASRPAYRQDGCSRAA